MTAMQLKGYTSPLNIVEAMVHPKLFGQFFQGSSWEPWQSGVLKPAFGLPMTDDEVAFFRTISGGRSPPKQRVKELWIIAGRRAGKDSVASLIVAYQSALFSGQAKLRPGERACCLLLACDRTQAGIVAGYIKSYFEHIPPFKALVTRETVDGLELSNGIDIVIATNSHRSTRGFAVENVTLDEVAYYHDETTSRSDVATYRALKPGTVTLDGLIVGISTPHRQAGLLYDQWKKYFGKDDPNVLVIQSPSQTLNPTLPAEVIEQALADDPISAAAEYMAEWRSDLAGFISQELLDAAVDRGVSVRPPQSNFRYASFGDTASGSGKDSFAVAITHAEGDQSVLDNLFEVRPPFNPSTAIEQASALLKSYRIHTLKGDRYAAGFVVEAFARNGIRYEHSEHDRSEVYLECLPLLTSGRAKLLDHKRMLAQFASLERRVLPTGKDRVDHPRGDKHDDLSNAVAGALAASTGHRHPVFCAADVAAVRARGQARALGFLPQARSPEERFGERRWGQMRRGQTDY